MRSISWGRLGIAVVCSLSLLGSATARADDTYPNRPIRLVVPYGAGGASDTMARKFGQKLAERIGQSVVIENLPAAAGTLAYTNVARSAPDGYTLIYGTSSLPVNAVLKANPTYDPVRDFVPISMIVNVQNLLVVPSSLPAASVADLVKLAKSKPGELNYVSLGPGSTPHLSAELFRAAAGIDIQQVSYKQTTQAYTDLIENRVQIWVASLPSALPHVQSGKLRALAVAGSERSPSLPDVPTLIETGVNVETIFWQGLFAPAGTPPAILKKLLDASHAAVSDADTRAWYRKAGAEIKISSPEDLGRAVKADVEKWTKIANDIGLERK
jgi:tripartite-type tricarboxylate transporter receptor subunit TctC